MATARRRALLNQDGNEAPAVSGAPAKPAEVQPQETPAPAMITRNAPVSPRMRQQAQNAAAAPRAEAPRAEAPRAEAPRAEAPRAEAPRAEAPRAEAPRAEAMRQPAPAPARTMPTRQTVQSAPVNREPVREPINRAQPSRTPAQPAPVVQVDERYAHMFPNWDLVPPQILIRRVSRK